MGDLDFSINCIDSPREYRTLCGAPPTISLPSTACPPSRRSFLWEHKPPSRRITLNLYSCDSQQTTFRIITVTNSSAGPTAFQAALHTRSHFCNRIPWVANDREPIQMRLSKNGMHWVVCSPGSYRRQKPRQNQTVRRSTREIPVKDKEQTREPSDCDTLVWYLGEERGKETGLGGKSLRWQGSSDQDSLRPTEALEWREIALLRPPTMLSHWLEEPRAGEASERTLANPKLQTFEASNHDTHSGET